MRLPTSLLIKILFVSALLAACCCFYLTFSIDLSNGDGWFQVYPDDVDHLQTPRTQPTTRSRRQYLAFDKAAPRAVFARSHGSSSLPNAVPLRRTVPRAYADDERYHVLKKTNTTTHSILGERGGPKRPLYNGKPDWGSFHHGHDYSHDNRALYLQNPVVLALRNTLPDAPHDPDDLSPDDLRALTGGDPAVRYLALYSANTGGKCFGPERMKLYKTGEALSYYAVALLDANLDVIPGTDVLIDINVSPHWPRKPHYFQQEIGDCRVNLMEGWMYWVCCKHLFRVQIKRKSKKKEEHRPEKNNNNAELTFPYTFPNIYGDGLEITLFSGQLIAHGKNFNFFRAPSTTDDHAFDHYLQLFPVPHVHHKVRIPPFDDEQLGTIELVASGEQKQTAPLPPPAFDGPDTPHTIVTCPENEDGKHHKEWVTNCTTPDVQPFFHNKDHGTACCITLSLGEGEEQRDVLVGISHVKTTLLVNPWWRRDVRGKYDREDVMPMSRYLSRFVAYDVDPPFFHVAALSGWFCLGFGEEEEDVVGGGNVLMTGKNREVRLVLFDDAYDCPAIHFPSGIAEVVGDPTRAIIAYGINDCTQRMIVVEKEDVARRLLRGV